MSEWRRVVVTGLGVVTPLGVDVDRLWENVRAGRSGVKSITAFDASDLPTRFAATVDDFDPDRWISRKEARRMDRCTQMAVSAARMALADACLVEGEFDPYDVGVSVGTGMGGMHTLEDEHTTFLEGGARRVSPFLAPMMIPNMPAGQVSIQLGLRGPSRGLATACATGSDCIGEGFGDVHCGRAPVMLAGGVDASITKFVIAAFCSCKVLSRRNDAPARASRPFDRDRDGFVMGEGAGVVVLEDRERALARGVRIYAEVLGYGATADAFHMTSPDTTGEPMARAMHQALRQAGLPATALDYLNAHGTSTALNDKFETRAIKLALGEHAYRLPISSTKSMVGHLIGAAGAVEFIATVLSIRDGYVHPTINLDNPDPECDLDYVPNVGRAHTVGVAMTNSLAFGGHNASLVLAHPEAT
ncbi:MAG TPA: beta-ketoacyl-ACP synthase II [Chloroflexota bacterium]|nr:beta-ketoacyl-ACP synthase II [Chloroflexota bacterium]